MKPDVWEEAVRADAERRYAEEYERKNMNLECKISKTPMQVLEAIDQGLTDLEYWTPCEIAGPLARGWIARVEAPFGGYILEVTKEGYRMLAFVERAGVVK